MHKGIGKLLVTLLLVWSGATSAAYKCTDERGNPVFSDRPCGESAEEVSIEAPAESGSVVPGDFSAVRASSSVRDGERQIEYLEDRIERYERERDAKLDKLEKDSYRAANNLAGAQYQTSLATEMQAVSSNYSSKIAAERDKINRILDEIDRTNSSSD